MGFVSSRRRKARGDRLVRLIILVFIIISLYFLVASFLKGPQTLRATSLVSSNINPTVVNESLQQTVLNSLAGTEGTYAVAIKNLKTEESFYLNEHQSFEAGSLYKLWVMGETFKQIEAGILSPDETLSKSISQLNREFSVDPNTAELTEGGITLTVNSALNQMITISHNYAALLLTQRIKLSSVATFLDKYGFKASFVGTDGSLPITTASDIAIFFEKLYKGQLANPENTIQMIELLKKQTLNNKLPKYLPKDLWIAHKTGEIDYFSHDAGIVYSSGDYIIVVLSESNSPVGAEERIATLSKSVYDYFNK